MQASQFVQTLQSELAAMAELGDEQTAAAVRRIVVALQGSLGLTLFRVLGEAARELTPQIPDGRVEVRLVGADPELVFVREEEADVAAPALADEAATARITLRLPEGLKRTVEQAADNEGVSVNTWLIRAISQSVQGRGRRSGKRLTGFAES
jgi:HicB family